MEIKAYEDALLVVCFTLSDLNGMSLKEKEFIENVIILLEEINPSVYAAVNKYFNTLCESESKEEQISKLLDKALSYLKTLSENLRVRTLAWSLHIAMLTQEGAECVDDREKEFLSMLMNTLPADGQKGNDEARALRDEITARGLGHYMQDPVFGYEDALLSVCWLMAYLDSDGSKKENDFINNVVVAVENVYPPQIKKFFAKWNQLASRGLIGKLTTLSVNVLNTLSYEYRVRALAWAFHVSAISELNSDDEEKENSYLIDLALRTSVKTDDISKEARNIVDEVRRKGLSRFFL